VVGCAPPPRGAGRRTAAAEPGHYRGELEIFQSAGLEALANIKMSFFNGERLTYAARATIMETEVWWHVLGCECARQGDSARFVRMGVRQIDRRITVSPAFSYAIKDRRAAARSREWSHEDAAFLAILFQANFYVLPEKA
jgi:hypothetical protein